jgi:hypothetical protein
MAGSNYVVANPLLSTLIAETLAITPELAIWWTGTGTWPYNRRSPPRPGTFLPSHWRQSTTNARTSATAESTCNAGYSSCIKPVNAAVQQFSCASCQTVNSVNIPVAVAHQDPHHMDVDGQLIPVRDFAHQMMPGQPGPQPQGPLPGEFPQARGRGEPPAPRDAPRDRAIDDREQDPGLISKWWSGSARGVSSQDLHRANERGDRYKSFYIQKAQECEHATRQVQTLNREREDINRMMAELRAENEEFRTHIITLGSARQQLREEENYIHGLEDLRHIIEQSMVGLSRKHENVRLSEEVQRNILSYIMGLGHHGEKASKLLNLNTAEHLFAILYANNRARLPLIRHIIAIFVLHFILDPFAFAASAEVSEALKAVDTDFLFRGLSF